MVGSWHKRHTDLRISMRQTRFISFISKTWIHWWFRRGITIVTTATNVRVFLSREYIRFPSCSPEFFLRHSKYRLRIYEKDWSGSGENVWCIPGTSMDTNFCPDKFCRKFRPFMFCPSTSLTTRPFADFGVPGSSLHFPLSSVLFPPISVLFPPISVLVLFLNFPALSQKFRLFFANSVHFCKFRPYSEIPSNGQKSPKRTNIYVH